MAHHEQIFARGDELEEIGLDLAICYEEFPVCYGKMGWSLSVNI